MTGYIIINQDTVRVLCRFEGDGIVGDACHEVRPGESLQGWSYTDLLAHGEGAIELPKPANQDPRK